MILPDSPYRAVLVNSPLGDLLTRLWGSEDIWFLYEQVLLKEGRQARRTPWHQDSSYLPISGQMLAVIWINLESIDAESSLEFVRGSHRGPLYDGSAFDPSDDTKPIYGDGAMPLLPDIEAERARWPIVSWAVTAGDVIVFHPAMLHGGAPMRPGMRRRTISLRFFGTDAIYTPLPTNGVRGIGIEGKTIWDRLRITLQPGGHSAGSIAIKVAFVGLIPSKVHGQFAIINIAPTRKPISLLCHQAMIPKTQPTTARGACIVIPRL